MSSIGNYIKDLRLSKGWSQRQLATKADISNSTLSRLEKNETRPTIEILVSIANALDIDPSVIINESESMDLFKDIVKKDGSRMLTVHVPVVGSVRAGVPITATENIDGYIVIDKSQLKPNKEYFSVIITGDSMSQELPDGSYAVIEKNADVVDGDIAIVAVNGYEATIKKVQFTKDGVICFPLSNNPDYRPQFYNYQDDDVHVLGKLVMSIKKY